VLAVWEGNTNECVVSSWCLLRSELVECIVNTGDGTIGVDTGVTNEPICVVSMLVYAISWDWITGESTRKKLGSYRH
jgi:hypothetical protein